MVLIKYGVMLKMVVLGDDDVEYLLRMCLLNDVVDSNDVKSFDVNMGVLDY